MANAYCVKADVDDIWSEDGIIDRFDDDADGSLSAGEESRIDRVIIRASIFVGSKLRGRLDIDTIEGSNPPTNTPDSIKYMTAVVAAYYAATRRGLGCPQEVKDQYEQVVEILTQIQQGGPLPIDLNEDYDFTPFTSNFEVDGTYITRKIRVTRGNSTRDEPGDGIKRAREDLLNTYGFLD